MKIKELAIEITLFCLSASTVFYLNYIVELGYVKSFGLGFVMGLCGGYYFIYWTMKRQIVLEERPNSAQIINIWRYILVGACLAAILIAFLFQKQIVDSDRIWFIYFFVMTMVMGNYRAKIEPNHSESAYIYLEDEEVNRKTKRYSGKLSVVAGLLAIATVPFLSNKQLMLLALGYTFLMLLLPYFYAKRSYFDKYK